MFLTNLFLTIGENTSTNQCIWFFHQVKIPDILKNQKQSCKLDSSTTISSSKN